MIRNVSSRVLVLVIIFSTMAATHGTNLETGMQAEMEANSEDPSRLLVVWTSGDREVALKMVFMYTFNAKRLAWWDTVRLLVWGPSAKLLSEDKELQDYVQKMELEGVELYACKACADSYQVSDKLESIGIKVMYTGEALTHMLKSDWKIVTF